MPHTLRDMFPVKNIMHNKFALQKKPQKAQIYTQTKCKREPFQSFTFLVILQIILQ